MYRHFLGGYAILATVVILFAVFRVCAYMQKLITISMVFCNIFFKTYYMSILILFSSNLFVTYSSKISARRNVL